MLTNTSIGPFMIENNIAYFTGLNYWTKVVLGLICLISFFWGFSLKLIIFEHFAKIKIWSKPINVLILFDEIICCFTNAIFLIQLSIWFFTDTHSNVAFETVFGLGTSSEAYCNFFSWVGTVNIAYGGLGGFGISIYR